jgi:hypothetical protein
MPDDVLVKVSKVSEKGQVQMPPGHLIGSAYALFVQIGSNKATIARQTSNS